MRIVFLGTPDFAVATLDALLKDGHQMAVVTAPDKPAGRGMKLQHSAVKQFAIQQQLPILQPDKLRSESFLTDLKQFNADLFVVVAFRMLPEVVWNMPRLGTINLHASLLPQYRGAAPINWAIINGESETGVTTFKLKHEIDTGDILLQKAVPIADDETAGELHDKLKLTGAQVVVETVRQMETGAIEERPQTYTHNLKKAPKIFTETCRIDWTMSVHDVFNLIRGLSPYPAAFTSIKGKVLKIFKASKIIGQNGKAPGELVTDSRTFLHFSCPDGFLAVHELQLEGKKRMTVEEFLRGYR